MLYAQKMKDILKKFGVDTSKLPNSLYSTLLDAIYNANVGGSIKGVKQNEKGSTALTINTFQTRTEEIEINGMEPYLKVGGETVYLELTNEDCYVVDLTEQLSSENIKAGVTIFGVEGTYTGGEASKGATFDDLLEYQYPLDIYSKNLEKFGSTCLSGNSFVKTVEFPGCTMVAVGALKGCTNLKKITLGANNLDMQLNGSAFEGCKNLKEVTINNSYVYLFSRVFGGCNSLYYIKMPNLKTKPYLDDNSYFMYSGTQIFIPDNLVAATKADSEWSVYADNIRPMSEFNAYYQSISNYLY